MVQQPARYFKPNDFHCKMIGRQLWNQIPELAELLLKPYLSAEPFDYNFTRIEDHYLSAFCSLYGITKNDMQGPQYKSTKVDIRRIFISAMVHIYCPHVYFQDPKEINLSKKGFVKWLAKALRQHDSNVSDIIKEVISWEHDKKLKKHPRLLGGIELPIEKTYYDDFVERVYEVVDKLKNIA